MYVLLSNSQAGPCRNFSQPHTSLFRGLCQLSGLRTVSIDTFSRRILSLSIILYSHQVNFSLNLIVKYLFLLILCLAMDAFFSLLPFSISQNLLNERHFGFGERWSEELGEQGRAHRFTSKYRDAQKSGP